MARCVLEQPGWDIQGLLLPAEALLPAARPRRRAGAGAVRSLQNRTLFLPLRDNANLRPVSFRYLELFRPQRIALAWANCEFCGTDRMARPALAHISDVGKGNIEEDIEDIDRIFLRRKT